MKRRGFLSFLGLAPFGAAAAREALEQQQLDELMASKPIAPPPPTAPIAPPPRTSAPMREVFYPQSPPCFGATSADFACSLTYSLPMRTPPWRSP